MSLPTIFLTPSQFQRWTAYRIDPLMRSRVIVMDNDFAPYPRQNFEVQVKRAPITSSGFMYEVIDEH